MEKIYEEDQQQKKQKKQKNKKIKLDGVTILSFAVALFAIVSLIAAGVSGFSFALPDTTVTLPSTFTGAEDDSFYMQDGKTMQEVNYHYYNNGSSNIPLLCLERDITFNPGTFNIATGDKAGMVSDDIGLLYLLGNLYPNTSYTYPSGFNTPSGKENYVNFWISQMAVWAYLHEKGYDNNSGSAATFRNVGTVSWVYIGPDGDDILRNDTCDSANSAYCFGFLNNTNTIFDAVTVNGISISTLISRAKAKTGMAYSIDLDAGDGVVSTDSNSEYYFSPKYTVVPSVDSTLGELTSYSLAVTAKDKDGQTVDVNAVITDEAGNVKSDVSALTYADLSKFYVRIPVNKITKKVTVNVKITGTFKMYEGRFYTSGTNTQKVTTVQFTNDTDSGGKDFEIVPTEDTGISAGQTIYFIGLIVLLCGVGIIYANAKPAKAQI